MMHVVSITMFVVSITMFVVSIEEYFGLCCLDVRPGRTVEIRSLRRSATADRVRTSLCCADIPLPCSAGRVRKAVLFTFGQSPGGSCRRRILFRQDQMSGHGLPAGDEWDVGASVLVAGFVGAGQVLLPGFPFSWE